MERKALLIIDCSSIDKGSEKILEARRQGGGRNKLTGALADAPPGVADIACISGAL